MHPFAINTRISHMAAERGWRFVVLFMHDGPHPVGFLIYEHLGGGTARHVNTVSSLDRAVAHVRAAELRRRVSSEPHAL